MCNGVYDYWNCNSLVKRGWSIEVASHIGAEDRGIGRVMDIDTEWNCLEDLVNPGLLI